MIYVFFQYWIFVALAFVLGLFVGWATCTGDDTDRRSGWLAWAVAAFLVGLFLAAFRLVPGLPGHMLEVALMLFAAYIVGCVTGCGGRSVAGGDDDAPAHTHGHEPQGATHPDAAATKADADAHARAPQPAPISPAASSPGASPAAAGTVCAVSADTGAAAAQSTQAAPVEQGGTASALSMTAAATGVEDAKSAVNATAPAAAPDADRAPVHAEAPTSSNLRGVMTDGQRTIQAAKEKLAVAREKLATPKPEAQGGEAPAPAIAAEPGAFRPPPSPAGAPSPKTGMTDGQRSIAAAKQKMAEKARATGQGEPVSPAGATQDAARGDAGSETSAQGEHGEDGARPMSKSDPSSPADDLKLIRGVGPKNEAALNDLGVRRFTDIADWNADNEAWVGRFIQFPGRIEREQWVTQAKLLAAGIDTAHAAAVRSGALTLDESADAPLAPEDVKALADSLPRMAPKVDNEAAHEGARPLGLAAARASGGDDLKLIKGIGPQNEERLHKLGIWHFDQIAAWTAQNVKWVGSYLAFPGRIDREEWIAQARALARDGTTNAARRAEQGETPGAPQGKKPRDAGLI